MSLLTCTTSPVTFQGFAPPTGTVTTLTLYVYYEQYFSSDSDTTMVSSITYSPDNGVTWVSIYSGPGNDQVGIQTGEVTLSPTQNLTELIVKFNPSAEVFSSAPAYRMFYIYEIYVQVT